MGWHTLYSDLTREQAGSKLRSLKSEKSKLVKRGGKGNYRNMKIIKGRQGGTVFGGAVKQRYDVVVEPY